jgi:hypothetical protein
MRFSPDPDAKGATHVLPPGLLVVHDTGRGGEDDLAERAGREEQVDPVLNYASVNGRSAK